MTEINQSSIPIRWGDNVRSWVLSLTSLERLFNSNWVKSVCSGDVLDLVIDSRQPGTRLIYSGTHQVLALRGQSTILPSYLMGYVAKVGYLNLTWPKSDVYLLS